MNYHRARFILFSCALLALLPARMFGGTSFFNAWAAARMSDVPAESGVSGDPDLDGKSNLVEFAFGSDPRSAASLPPALSFPAGVKSGTNGAFTVEILELQGRQPGVQIDLQLSSNLSTWVRPGWLRVTGTSKSGDPASSVREQFTTWISGTSKRTFVRSMVQLVESGSTTAKYYVAPGGSDISTGTSSAAPFATLGKATGLAQGGDLIYV